jgi:hypothetical protein
MLGINLEVEFPQAVSTVIKNRLGRYGFVVRLCQYAGVAYAESELWQLEIIYRFQSVNVALGLVSEANAVADFLKSVSEANTGADLSQLRSASPVDFDPVALSWPSQQVSHTPEDLWHILEVVAPALSEHERYPRKTRSVEEVTHDLDRQIMLLLRHCDGLLKGDVQQWEQVREAGRRRYGMSRREDESWDGYLLRLRETAEAALRQKEYRKADGYYGWLSFVGGRMTVRDKWRHWTAARHTFMLA